MGCISSLNQQKTKCTAVRVFPTGGFRWRLVWEEPIWTSFANCVSLRGTCGKIPSNLVPSSPTLSLQISTVLNRVFTATTYCGKLSESSVSTPLDRDNKPSTVSPSGSSRSSRLAIPMQVCSAVTYKMFLKWEMKREEGGVLISPVSDEVPVRLVNRILCTIASEKKKSSR